MTLEGLAPYMVLEDFRGNRKPLKVIVGIWRDINADELFPAVIARKWKVSYSCVTGIRKLRTNRDLLEPYDSGVFTWEDILAWENGERPVGWQEPSYDAPQKPLHYVPWSGMHTKRPLTEE